MNSKDLAKSFNRRRQELEQQFVKEAVEMIPALIVAKTTIRYWEDHPDIVCRCQFSFNERLVNAQESYRYLYEYTGFKAERQELMDNIQNLDYKLSSELFRRITGEAIGEIISGRCASVDSTMKSEFRLDGKTQLQGLYKNYVASENKTWKQTLSRFDTSHPLHILILGFVSNVEVVKA